uniref:Uncharacterized protein n=1 Tax=Nelumbo nucifera TaxID=4432 RepID=A0A822YQ24_NELNU|nr:TPA_asm: hypothetical protein HUJ06_005332 [Nelumbo nucifera]
MSTFDSSMALTVVVLLTALFFMGFRRFAEENALELLRRRRQQRRAAASTSSALCLRGVDPTTVKSLPGCRCMHTMGSRRSRWIARCA